MFTKTVTKAKDDVTLVMREFMGMWQSRLTDELGTFICVVGIKHNGGIDISPTMVFNPSFKKDLSPATQVYVLGCLEAILGDLKKDALEAFDSNMEQLMEDEYGI
jgi:hypothetical protein